VGARGGIQTVEMIEELMATGVRYRPMDCAPAAYRK